MEYSYVFRDIEFCIADRRDDNICMTITINLSKYRLHHLKTKPIFRNMRTGHAQTRLYMYTVCVNMCTVLTLNIGTSLVLKFQQLHFTR